MKKPWIITLIALTIGILLFMIQHHFLIIHWRYTSQHAKLQPIRGSTSKKNYAIYFWKDDKFHHEQASLLVEEGNIVRNLKELVTAWLSTHKDERIVRRNIEIESVVLSSDEQEAFISFNQSPLKHESSISQKWNVVESLLKTIREANIPIQKITLLTHHGPIEDDHIDFSQPFPITGFTEQ